MHTYPRILIAQRAGDGLVHIGALDDADARIQLLSAYGVDIDRHFTSAPTPQALVVASRMKSQFDLARMDAAGPWFAAEYGRVVAALEEFDLETGERTKAAHLSVGSRVSVKGAGHGTGVVSGFSQCGRVRVLVSSFKPAAMELLAPAHLVFPA